MAQSQCWNMQVSPTLNQAYVEVNTDAELDFAGFVKP